MIVTDAITGTRRRASSNSALDREERRLDVQGVERRLDQQQVDAAVDEPARLLVVGLDELVDR